MSVSLPQGTSSFAFIFSPSMKAYAATARRLFEQNDSVAKFRTLIALDRVKVETQLISP